MTYRYLLSPVRWAWWISTVSAFAEFHQPTLFHSPVLGLYQRCSAPTASPAQARYSSGSGCMATAAWLRLHGYGVGAPGWLAGCPALKCNSASAAVASVSQRVSELRGSSASATHASAVYQASDHGATSTQAKVSAHVAASTAGTSGDRRLYRYHASASSSGGHSAPITAETVDACPGSRRLVTPWISPQTDGEITRDEAPHNGLIAVSP